MVFSGAIPEDDKRIIHKMLDRVAFGHSHNLPLAINSTSGAVVVTAATRTASPTATEELEAVTHAD